MFSDLIQGELKNAMIDALKEKMIDAEMPEERVDNILTQNITGYGKVQISKRAQSINRNIVGTTKSEHTSPCLTTSSKPILPLSIWTRTTSK